MEKFNVSVEQKNATESWFVSTTTEEQSWELVVVLGLQRKSWPLGCAVAINL
jgi:hypothetical protein